MAKKEHTVFIKNMVCPRCILSVERILDGLKIPYKQVLLGEVFFEKALTPTQQRTFEKEIKKVGFEIIESRLNKIIEDIKLLVIEYIQKGAEKNANLSTFITQKLPYDYSYLSDLFSSAEGKPIEQYFIAQRIEKAKELLAYDQLSLTEIAYQLGFSSVHHLSAQFKKIAGFTPSQFKKMGKTKRKPLG